MVIYVFLTVYLLSPTSCASLMEFPSTLIKLCGILHEILHQRAHLNGLWACSKHQHYFFCHYTQYISLLFFLWMDMTGMTRTGSCHNFSDIVYDDYKYSYSGCLPRTVSIIALFVLRSTSQPIIETTHSTDVATKAYLK